MLDKIGLRLKVELAAASAIGTIGLLVGVQITNPSGFQKYVLTVLGSASTSVLAFAVVSTLTSPVGALRLDLSKLQSQNRVLQDKLDKEYLDAKSLLATIEQLQDSLTKVDFEKLELTKGLEEGKKFIENWKGIAGANQDKINSLNLQIQALQTEVRTLEESFESRLSEEAHRRAKAKANQVVTRQYQNYKRDLTEREAEAKAECDARISQYQARVDELKRQTEELETKLSELSTEKSELTQVFTELSQKDLPDIQATFEREWLENDLALQKALEDLRQANARLQSPRMFAGETLVDIRGNRIIQHFYQYGIVLDAIESLSIPQGWRLRFKCDRTGDFTKLAEEEFDKRTNEPGLMGLSHANLDFSLDTRNFILSVELVDTPHKATNPTNRQTASQIAVDEPLPRFYAENNLLPSSEFSQVYELLLNTPSVPSVRVMGGSGSGKSSVVRLLLSAELASQKTRIRLHDPQSGSSEDRWKFPKISEDLESTAKAMSSLLELLDNKTAPPVNTIDVFDELDSAMRNKTHGAELKEAYLSVMTRVRHLQNQKLLVIGQNAKVGRTGLQWSDIDNCGNLYIGESAVHAIKSSPSLEGNKETLKKQVDAIRAHCQQRNNEEGLKGNEPNAYRFALVKAPNRDPFWVELPSFSEGVQPMENLIKGDIASITTSHACPHCGSGDLRINRKNPNGSTQHRCRSCGKYHSK